VGRKESVKKEERRERRRKRAKGRACHTIPPLATSPAAVRVSQPEPVHRLKYHQNR